MRDRGTTFRSGACGTRADYVLARAILMASASFSSSWSISLHLRTTGGPCGPPSPAVSERTPRFRRPRRSTAVPIPAGARQFRVCRAFL